MRASGTEQRVREAFQAQADWCARMGSPFTAALCRVIGDRVDRETRVGARLLAWPGDPGGWADGLPLRICGGLHALVRRKAVAALVDVYPPRPRPDDARLWGAVRVAFADEADFLLGWIEGPPQTNEVGRGSALIAGLAVVAERFGLPIELLELGASAGLNLLLDRYRHELGGVVQGDPASALRLAPEWQGSPPRQVRVEIVGRRGVDRLPVDPVADAERLLAFVWADQPERMRQLEAALAIARKSPPSVDKGDAAAWLEERLPIEGRPGFARVVQHSVAFQYFDAETQARVTSRIEAAGARATREAPLGWLRFEKEADDRETALRLRLWPGGEELLLAECQPHGRRISWRSPAR